MEIHKGFKIDSPDLFINWGIKKADFISLFPESKLKKVTGDYYTAECISLGGLSCNIGFHFDGNIWGKKLKELEFFRNDYSNQRQSFYEFQKYFETAFGQPTTTTQGTEGFPNHNWNLESGVQIVHYIFDRFGPEEHMRIRKI
ncbi:hypothetical protein ACD591_14465 [Rufibacter glacialis]|uniref:Uncharacterized protein n=1 Tax=Rufibacter glacialis TaxID=1259555 RepID=A0A5M8QS97_9BACT|nr:hypothetical protein [Rufibacter glacialis]KAA6437834.1 hypothetical protein FOE74_04860 [Rufibacter glacialis]GGK55962.1 hypothetical protein GCM10011405_00030 [Rufibacter glacialis]